jgi:hypothetical protein
VRNALVCLYNRDGYLMKLLGVVQWAEAGPCGTWVVLATAEPTTAAGCWGPTRVQTSTKLGQQPGIQYVLAALAPTRVPASCCPGLPHVHAPLQLLLLLQQSPPAQLAGQPAQTACVLYKPVMLQGMSPHPHIAISICSGIL